MVLNSLNNELKNRVEEDTMTRGMKRKIEKYILYILRINKKLTEKELYSIINRRHSLQKVPETTLHDKLAELTEQEKIFVDIEKIGTQTRKTYSLNITERIKFYQENDRKKRNLEKKRENQEKYCKSTTNPVRKEFNEKRRAYMEKLTGEKIEPLTPKEEEELTKLQSSRPFEYLGYGWPYGIHKISDREKAKEFFDKYLPFITRRFVNGLLLQITKLSFSPEGQKIIGDMKNNSNPQQVSQRVMDNLVMPYLQKHPYSLYLPSLYVMELFANADVAFGKTMSDPEASVTRYIEEVQSKNYDQYINQFLGNDEKDVDEDSIKRCHFEKMPVESDADNQFLKCTDKPVNKNSDKKTITKKKPIPLHFVPESQTYNEWAQKEFYLTQEIVEVLDQQNKEV
jgi:hypothetical protein